MALQQFAQQFKGAVLPESKTAPFFINLDIGIIESAGNSCMDIV
jgi:hypothetical protein